MLQQQSYQLSEQQSKPKTLKNNDFTQTTSTYELKAFTSEKSTLKLYLHNTAFTQRLQNNFNSKLCSERISESVQGSNSALNSPNFKVLTSKIATQMRPVSKKSSSSQLKISDLIRKKADTQQCYYDSKGVEKKNRRDLSQQLSPGSMMSNSFVRVTAMATEKSPNNKHQPLDFKSSVQQSVNQQGEPTQQQYHDKQHYLQNTNTQNLINSNEERYNTNSMSQAQIKNSVGHSYLVENLDMESFHQKDAKILEGFDSTNSRPFKVGSPRSELQSGLTSQKLKSTKEKLKRSQTSKSSKGQQFFDHFISEEEVASNGQDSEALDQQQGNLLQPQSLNKQPQQKSTKTFSKISEKIQTLKQKSINSPRDSQVESLFPHNKVNKGTNSSFYSSSSKSNGQFESGNAGAAALERGLNQQHAGSKSILGSTFTSSTNNSTPVGIYNPEHITQQLVKQNLMIFNRKELFSAQSSRNSNTYTASQRIIFQQNQNRNLYKQYQLQQQNIQNKYIPNEGDNKPSLCIKASKLSNPIINIDNENSSSQLTKLFLSRSILGNTTAVGGSRTGFDKKDLQMNSQTNKIKNGVDEDIAISPLLDGDIQSVQQQALDQDKSNLIRDLISKKNQKQIPLSEAPFFQNKLLISEQISKSPKNQCDQLQSPKSSAASPKSKQFAYSMQINIQSTQNALKKDQFHYQYSARSNYLPEESKKEQYNNLSKSQHQIQINNSIDEIIGSSCNKGKEDIDEESSVKESKYQQNSPKQEPQFNKVQTHQSNSQNKFQFPEKRLSERIYIKQIDSAIVDLDNSLDSDHLPSSLEKNPRSQNTQKLNLRPMTSLPFNRKNTPLSPHQEFLSKVLSTERNVIYERIKGLKDSEGQLQPQNIKQELSIPIDFYKLSQLQSLQSRQNSSYFKTNNISSSTNNNSNNNNNLRVQKQQKNEEDNQQPQHFSPWQNNNTSNKYDEDDSMDFIQYTISS